MPQEPWSIRDVPLFLTLTFGITWSIKAQFMVAALENDGLIHEAPAIVGRQTASAIQAIAA